MERHHTHRRIQSVSTATSAGSCTFRACCRNRNRNSWVYLLLATAITQQHAFSQTQSQSHDDSSIFWGPNDNENCIVSQYERSDGHDSKMTYLTEFLPDFLQFGCWNNTFVNVSLQSGLTRTTNDMFGSAFAIFTGEPYTFHFSVHLDLNDLQRFVGLHDLSGPIRCAVRLLFCNALHLRGCDLLVQGVDNPESLGHANITKSIQPKYNGEKLTMFKEVDYFVSPWVTLDLQASNFDNNTHKGDTYFAASLPPTSSGAFFILGHAYVILQSRNTTTGVDIAKNVIENAAVVSSSPLIQTVSKAMTAYTYAVSSIFGLFALSCFAFILVHRKHPVMTLSQGSFLAALAAACFLQIFFCFTYLPTRDIFCTISGPLEIIPLHLGGAILIARVWRAYSALSVANVIGRKVEDQERRFRLNLSDKYIRLLSWLAHLPMRFSREHRRPIMRQTLRKKVTAAETACLAAMITLPQVVLQIFGAAYYRRGLEEQIDTAGDVGRIVCEANGRWVNELGIGIAALVYIGAVVVAWIARLLPSVFNEKNQVFHAAFVNCLLAFITIPLVELTNDPNDSPDVAVFLRSLMSIGIGTTDLVIIVVPKIRRVWSGEKLVITNVLDSRFKPVIPSTTSEESHNDENESERVCLKEGDPLPRAIEQHVLNLHDVLRLVEHKCCDGRPLTSEEWRQLRDFTHLLDIELSRIDIEVESASAEEQPPS